MPQNPVFSRLGVSVPNGLVPAALTAIALALVPLQLVSDAQEQAPAAPAAAPGGRGGGRGLGGGRGFGPTMKPSALRAIPAETTAAKAKDPNWKAPRNEFGVRTSGYTSLRATARWLTR